MEYKFGRSTLACPACGHEFATGEAYISALVEPTSPDPAANRIAAAVVDDDEPIGLERRESCVDCFDAEARAVAVGFWRNRRAPRPLLPPVKDPELLWMLLGHTLRDGALDRPDHDRDPLGVHLLYLSALALMRLKQLTLARHFRDADGRTFLFFQARDSEQLIAVRDPEPDDKTLATVEALLGRVADRLRVPEAADVLAAAGAEGVGTSLVKSDKPEPESLESVLADESSRFADTLRDGLKRVQRKKRDKARRRRRTPAPVLAGLEPAPSELPTATAEVTHPTPPAEASSRAQAAATTPADAAGAPPEKLTSTSA